MRTQFNIDTVFTGIIDMAESMNGDQFNFQFETLSAGILTLIENVKENDVAALLLLKILRAASIGIVVCDGLRTGELYLGRLKRDDINESKT